MGVEAEVSLVLIVEDQEATSAWMGQLAAELYPLAAVHRFAGVRATLNWIAACPSHEAPICLVDLGLPDGSGIEVIRALTAKMPKARAIVMTLYDDDTHVLEAMCAGAVGYLLKDQEPSQVCERLRAIDRGEVAISPAISRRMLSLFRSRADLLRPADPNVSLTPRETDVLRLIGRGLRIAEAAAALGISTQTAASYLKIVYRKLAVDSRAEAALEAARRGLV